jgi:hypothetical protein
MLLLLIPVLACSASPTNGEAPRRADGAAHPPADTADDRIAPVAPAPTEGPSASPAESPADAAPAPPAVAEEEAEAEAAPPAEPRVIRFPWCPSQRVAEAYEMADPADQHRLVLPPGVEDGGRYPVVIGFHGQPKRGKPPREYGFTGRVEAQVVELVRAGEVRPMILALPVFRFIGSNWPYFNPRAFAREVERLLAERRIEVDGWYAFGHSGAAGCGGGGLNQIHLLKPRAVGFFDTCLGQGWVSELEQLRQAGIPTVNVHSVETAAFKPRQRPEYQSTFDFGRAYGPAGMKPVKCPAVHPGERLRDQRYRCAASGDGVVRGFVVDSGEGAEAHRAVIAPAVRYFLIHFAELGPS